MAINAGAPTRIKTSSITNPTATPENHTLVLGQLKESAEVAQRLRGDPKDSFVRVSELVSALGARLVNGTIQPPTPGAAVSVAVVNSITGIGTTTSPLELVGDVTTPGNSKLYGTNSSGVRGWYAQGASIGTLAVTDGTHAVTSVTTLTVAGAVVSGTSPNATITITAAAGAGGIGPPGLDGEPGPDGDRGPPGVNGVAGAAGSPGSIGAPGLDGEPGLDGDRGPPGIQGAAGTPGAQGATGPAVFLDVDVDIPEPLHVPGPQGPAGPVSQGPLQFVFLTDHEAPDDPAVIPGQTGQPGQTGVAGQAGAVGMPGADGDPGEEGMPVPGPQGPPGPAIQGPAGPAVFLDADGLDGEPGPPGAAGLPGAAGAPGAQGVPGPAVFLESEAEVFEPPHVPGPQGPPGPSIQGPAGPAVFLEMEADIQEPLHVPGPQGPQGPQGATGSSGSGGGGFEILYNEVVPEDAWFTGVGTIYPGGNLTVNGRFLVSSNLGNGSLAAIIDSGTSSTSHLLLSAVNDTNGVNLQLQGNGATPNKFLRVQSGVLQIINSAYTTNLFSFTDAGALSTFCTSGSVASFNASGQGAVLQLAAPSTFGATLQVMGNGVGTGKSLMLQQDTAQNGIIRQQDTGSLFLGTGATNWASVNATGNWIFTTPSSGIAMTVNGTSAIQAVQVNSGANPMVVLDSTQAAGGYAAFTRSGTAYGHIGNGGALGGTTDHMTVRATTALDFLTNAGTQLAGTIASAGNWTIEAPTSGNALTINQNTGGGDGIFMNLPAGLVGVLAAGNGTGSMFQGITAAGHIQLGSSSGTTTELITNNTPRLAIDLNGATTIPAPAAGTALTVNGVIASPASPLAATVTQAFTGLANFKASTTTVANNTLVADASLTVTVNEVGWYRIEAMLYIFEAASGAGGVQFDINGGTAVIANALYASSGVSVGATYSNSARGFTVASNLTPVATSSTTPDWSKITGTMQVTTAGTIAIRWAQGTTLGADPTSVAAGSHIVLTKIG